LTYNDVPVNKYDKIYIYSQINFIGDCFLADPESLLYNAYKYKNRDLAYYIALAARRSLSDYFAYGDLTLDLLHLDSNKVSIIEDSMLLSIEDGKVHFLYEEAN